MKELSRREFMKMATASAIAALVLAKLPQTAQALEGPPHFTDEEWAKMDWSSCLIRDPKILESELTMGNVPDGIFDGPLGITKAKITSEDVNVPVDGITHNYRIVKLSPDHLKPSYLYDPVHTNESQKLPFAIDTLLGQCEEILILQEYKANVGWVTTNIPGSVKAVENSRKIVDIADVVLKPEISIDPNSRLTAISLLQDVLLNPASNYKTVEQTNIKLDESAGVKLAIPLDTKRIAKSMSQLAELTNSIASDKLATDILDIGQKILTTLRGEKTDRKGSVKVAPIVTADDLIRSLVKPEFADALIQSIPSLRSNSAGIPEQLSPNMFAQIYKACYLPPNDSDFEMMSQIVKRASGVGNGIIFVPKAPESVQTAIDNELKKIVPIPEVPNVYFIKRKTFMGEEETQIYVDFNDGALYDHSVKSDLPITTFSEEANWVEVNDQAILQELDGKFGLTHFGLDKIVSVRKLSSGSEGWVIVANKFKGKEESRLIPCLWYTVPASLDAYGGIIPAYDSAIMLGKYSRDKIIPTQDVDQPWNNWLTDASKQVRAAKNNNIGMLNINGAMTVQQSFARLMKGLRLPGSLKSHLAMLPNQPALKDLLASMFIDTVRTDKFDRETNFLVATADTPIVQITGDKLGMILSELKDASIKANLDIESLTDTLTVNPDYKVDGIQLKLEQGDWFVFREKITIKGEEFILLYTERDDNGGIIANVGNTLIRDIIPFALAVPYEVAKRSLVALDPDDNIEKAIIEVAEVMAVSTFIISLVVAPEVTGAVVGGATESAIVTTGTIIQKSIFKVLTALTSSIIK